MRSYIELQLTINTHLEGRGIGDTRRRLLLTTGSYKVFLRACVHLGNILLAEVRRIVTILTYS